jgi:two-component system response regulator TctD
MSTNSSVERNLIAIVEDEEDLAILFQDALAHNGFKVMTFGDSVAAFEHISLHHLKYRLILSDIRMPRINGIELIRRIHKRDRRIKFILMSAFDRPEISSDFPTPPYVFVQKPIDMEELDAIVSRNTDCNSSDLKIC